MYNHVQSSICSESTYDQEFNMFLRSQEAMLGEKANLGNPRPDPATGGGSNEAQ